MSNLSQTTPGVGRLRWIRGSATAAAAFGHRLWRGRGCVLAAILVVLSACGDTDDGETLADTGVADTEGLPDGLSNGGDTAQQGDTDGDDAEANMVEPTGLDRDGDGVLDADEEAIRVIQIDTTGFGLRRPEFLERREVTSDPMLRDTDGDGLDDGEELLLRTDPRARDTDGDNLSDFDEVRRWQTSPISVDSDGDARGDNPDDPTPPFATLFDGAELRLDSATGQPNLGATSPTSADTDGDGVGDGTEIRSAVRDPVIAELPQVELAVIDSPDVRLRVEFTDTRGGASGYGSTLGMGSSSSTTQVDAESTRQWQDASVSASAELTIGIPPGVKSTITTTLTNGTASGTRVGNSEGGATSFSDAYRNFESESFGRTVRNTGGSITMGLEIRNTGSQAYQIRDMGVTVRLFDPVEQRYRTLTVLQPPAGFDRFTLSPFGEPSPIIPFVDDTLDAGTVQEILQNPGALLLEPANYQLFDRSGENFAFSTEDIFARTALIIIDYGNGTVERYRVATNIARGPGGELLGKTLGEALTEAGVDFETEPDADTNLQTLVRVGDFAAQVHEGPAPDLGDPEYPEGLDPGPRTARALWAIFAGRNGPGTVDLDTDFAETRLLPADEIRLIYVKDEDRDGVFTPTEAARGALDRLTQSDRFPGLADEGDRLSDWFEIRVGWEVQLLGDDPPPPVRVYPNPLLRDSDGDGWDDREEYERGTNPLSVDTDGDGLLDNTDLEELPLTPTNTPPEINLSLQRTANSIALVGSIADREENIRVISIDWGDGSQGSNLRADEDFDGLDLSNVRLEHCYRKSGRYPVTVRVTDIPGLSAQATFDPSITAFPVDPVAYIAFDGEASRTQCFDVGNELRDDRRGNVNGACYYMQNPGEPKYTAVSGDFDLEENVTIAAWVRPSGQTDGFVVGQVGFPALIEEEARYGFAIKTGIDAFGSRVVAWDDTPFLDMDRWHFLVGVLSVEAGGSRLRFYRDGRLVSEEFVPDYIHRDDNCSLNLAGYDISDERGVCHTGVSPWQGSLDDVRIYRRALPAAEVGALYDEVGRITALPSACLRAPVVYLPFDTPEQVQGCVPRPDAGDPRYVSRGGDASVCSFQNRGQTIPIEQPGLGTDFSLAVWLLPINTRLGSLVLGKSDGPLLRVGSNADTQDKLILEWGDAQIVETRTLEELSESTISSIFGWLLYTVVVNEDNGATILELYRGDFLIGSVPAPTHQTNFCPVVLGGSIQSDDCPMGNRESFRGTFDDVRIFDRALSAEEVRGLWED